MTKRILILAALVLGACGDDDGTPMSDAGLTPPTSIAPDTGVTPDSGPADAGLTPDTGPTTDEIDRYLVLERLDTQQFCECAVEGGNFADVDACFAADPAAISTDEEVACLRTTVTSGSDADQAIFECINDAGQADLDCRAALSCEDYSASPPSDAFIACDDAASIAYDACGTASNAEAINNCFD
ncbi:MAG: hypothetical protein AB8H86_19565 [Polyangiales bacterium]